jgi:hypothetical protein
LHAKSTTGTILTIDGGDTTTGAADTGASLVFNGNDGTFARTWAQIGGFKENSTNQNTASYLSFSTRANGGSVTERMRLDSSGNLGIGTSSPSGFLANKLVIATGGTANEGMTIYSSSNNGSIWFADATTGTGRYAGGLDYTHSDDTLIFYSAAQGNMRLNASGNLGLGVTPSAWGTSGTVLKAVQVGTAASFSGGSGFNDAFMASNAFFDGSNWKYINTATAYYASIGGTAAARWYTAPSGTAGNTISFTQAMTLDDNGQLNLGTTTAINNAAGRRCLTINGTSTSIITLAGGGAELGYMFHDGTAFEVWNAKNGSLEFGTNNTERARIASGGAMGVNLTNPQVFGQFTVKWDATATSTNNNVGIGIVPAADTTNATFMLFYNETGGTCGSVTRVAQTNAVAYNTSSDRRLKENIAAADDAGAVIDAIQIVKHDWKAGGHVRFGVVAQDLQVVAPEAVSAGDDGEDIEKTWGVDYSKLVPMLVKEIQSLRARVAQLESK